MKLKTKLIFQMVRAVDRNYLVDLVNQWYRNQGEIFFFVIILIVYFVMKSLF